MKVRIVNIIGSLYEGCFAIRTRKEYQEKRNLYRRLKIKWLDLGIVEYT
jgi:hypothetical protein